jgi:hypothetical protein
MSPPPSSTIVILDWDGTLCPTPQLRPIISKVQNGSNQKEKLYAFLENVGDWLEHLFAYLTSMHDSVSVYIVTDSPSGWVYDLASVLFPKIVPYLEDQRVTIWHASDMRLKGHQGTTSNNSISPVERLMQSKTPTFRHIVAHHCERKKRAMTVRPNLISVGDSISEHLAAAQCLKEGLVTRIQLVKFRHGLGLRQWQEQLISLKTLLCKLLTALTFTSCVSTSHCYCPTNKQWVCETHLPKPVTFGRPSRAACWNTVLDVHAHDSRLFQSQQAAAH